MERTVTTAIWSQLACARPTSTPTPGYRPFFIPASAVSQKVISMNPQNPYGVIQGMGQTGQTQYRAIGTFNTNQQAWTYPSGLLGNFTNACYSQGGYGEGHQGYQGYPSAPHPPYQNPDPNVHPDPYWDDSGTPLVFWRGPR
jgi:hypothetical protein